MSKVTENITDSVAQHQYYKPNYINGFNNDACTDTVINTMAGSTILTVPEGQKSENIIPSPLHDTGTMILFLLSIFFFTISYRKGFKYITNFKKNLFSLKKRENLFEDHNTFNETQLLIALIVNTCIMEAIIINCAISFYFPSVVFSTNIFIYIIALVLVMGLFYTAQFYTYYLLGYVFTTKTNTKLLLKGFQASQALLGLMLIPLVTILLFYPQSGNVVITLFIACYVVCRIVFIIKGLRIFFNNYSSFLLFILYLCTIEFIPLKLMYSGIIYLFSIF